MKIKKVLGGIDFSPLENEIKDLKKETDELVESIKKEIKKKKIDADVFVGGSFAKGTLASGDCYDIDIFIRFAWKYEDLSNYLEKIVSRIKGFKLSKIHGSRDYFRLSKGKKVTFEVIPVTRIRNPREARNVTDLSYFHVNYVRKRLKGALAGEILLAKTFCEAQGFYGAESYIQGFSGYGLECLMIYYKSFERFLKEMVKVGDRVIIDPEKKYGKKEDVLFELNESKLHSPIILVDPTWKERNALAALSKETFREFQGVARAFLKNPSEKYFEKVQINTEKLKKSNGEFLHLKLKTNRQEGDIAGTKLKKFSRFFESQIGKYFSVLKKEFSYDDKKSAEFYLVVKPKKEIVRVGPPVKMENQVKAFKKVNKNTFVKSGVLYSRLKIGFDGKGFVENWARENKKVMKSMGIIGLEII
tara:strand:+ start:2451 stop:3701 length:1251 start_codon:yes stop_codon:yes gene_type:complete